MKEKNRKKELKKVKKKERKTQKKEVGQTERRKKVEHREWEPIRDSTPEADRQGYPQDKQGYPQDILRKTQSDRLTVNHASQSRSQIFSQIEADQGINSQRQDPPSYVFVPDPEEKCNDKAKQSYESWRDDTLIPAIEGSGVTVATPHSGGTKMEQLKRLCKQSDVIVIPLCTAVWGEFHRPYFEELCYKDTARQKIMFLKLPPTITGALQDWAHSSRFPTYDCSSEKTLNKTVTAIVKSCREQKLQRETRSERDIPRIVVTQSYEDILRQSRLADDRAQSQMIRNSSSPDSMRRKKLNEIGRQEEITTAEPELMHTRTPKNVSLDAQSTRTHHTGMTSDTLQKHASAFNNGIPAKFFLQKDKSTESDLVSHHTGQTKRHNLSPRKDTIDSNEKVQSWIEDNQMINDTQSHHTHESIDDKTESASQVALSHHTGQSQDSRAEYASSKLLDVEEELEAQTQHANPHLLVIPGKTPRQISPLPRDIYDDATSSPQDSEFVEIPLVLREESVHVARSLDCNENIPGSLSDGKNIANIIEECYRKSNAADVPEPLKKYLRQSHNALDCLVINRQAILSAVRYFEKGEDSQWKGLVFLAALVKSSTDQTFCAFALKCLCSGLVKVRIATTRSAANVTSQLERLVQILRIPPCQVSKQFSSGQGDVMLELYLRAYRWLCLLVLANHCLNGAQGKISDVLSTIEKNCDILWNHVTSRTSGVNNEKQLIQRYINYTDRRYKSRLQKTASFLRELHEGRFNLDPKLRPKDTVLCFLCCCISGDVSGMDLTKMKYIGVNASEMHNATLLQILVRHLASVQQHHSADVVGAMIEKLVEGIHPGSMKLKPFISLPLHKYISSMKTDHLFLEGSELCSCIEDDLAFYSCKLDKKVCCNQKSRYLFTGSFSLKQNTPVLIIASQLLSEDAKHDIQRSEIEVFKRLQSSEENYWIPHVIGYHFGATGIHYHVLSPEGESRDLSEVLLDMLQGPSHKRRLSRRREMCRQQIEAIRFCHKNNILVRRICASVFRLVETSDGKKLKLCDFQNAKPCDSNKGLSCTGTKEELLPTLWLHKSSVLQSRYDKATDIYSCVMTLYETLSLGLHPFTELMPDQPWEARLIQILANNMLPERRPSIPLAIYQKIIDYLSKRHHSLESLKQEICREDNYKDVDEWKDGEDKLSWMQKLGQNQSRMLQEGIPPILHDAQTDADLKQILEKLDAHPPKPITVKQQKLKKILSAERRDHEQSKPTESLGKVAVCIIKKCAKIEERNRLRELCGKLNNDNENLVTVAKTYSASDSEHCKVHPGVEMLIGSVHIPLLLHALDGGATYFEQEHVHWYIQIAHGLSYLHKNGIVHCSLKAMYIYWTDKTVKIGQLNRATLLSKDVHNSSARDSEVIPYEKIPSDIVHWCPFETLTEGFMSTRSDVAMLGATIWELENCVHKGPDPLEHEVVPYGRWTTDQIILHQMKHEYLPKPDDCTDWLYKLIQNMTHVQQNKRPPIEHLLQELTSQRPSPPSPSQPVGKGPSAPYDLTSTYLECGGNSPLPSRTSTKPKTKSRLSNFSSLFKGKSRHKKDKLMKQQPITEGSSEDIYSNISYDSPKPTRAIAVRATNEKTPLGGRSSKREDLPPTPSQLRTQELYENLPDASPWMAQRQPSNATSDGYLTPIGHTYQNLTGRHQETTEYMGTVSHDYVPPGGYIAMHFPASPAPDTCMGDNEQDEEVYRDSQPESEQTQPRDLGVTQYIDNTQLVQYPNHSQADPSLEAENQPTELTSQETVSVAENSEEDVKKTAKENVQTHSTDVKLVENNMSVLKNENYVPVEDEKEMTVKSRDKNDNEVEKSPGKHVTSLNPALLSVASSSVASPDVTSSNDASLDATPSAMTSPPKSTSPPDVRSPQPLPTEVQTETTDQLRKNFPLKTSDDYMEPDVGQVPFLNFTSSVNTFNVQREKGKEGGN